MSRTEAAKSRPWRIAAVGGGTAIAAVLAISGCGSPGGSDQIVGTAQTPVAASITVQPFAPASATPAAAATTAIAKPAVAPTTPPTTTGPPQPAYTPPAQPVYSPPAQPAYTPPVAPAYNPPPVPAGDGTYTNVDGNTIPDPVSAAAPPPGATAQCNDGTYSFSQHHSGTCSSHGGVARWL
jgi:hypothetical protein